MVNMKRTLTTILLAASLGSAAAQSRILPLGDMAASAASLASGGSRYAGGGAAVYTRPSSAFAQDGSFGADYSAAIIPADGCTQTLHTLTAAWHGGRHAVLLGGRYWLQGKQDIFVDDNMSETSDPRLTMHSCAFDAGYAFAISQSMHAYATVGYVAEKALATVSAVRATVGADYMGGGSLFGLGAKYVAGASVSNIGRYSGGGSGGSLSPRIGLGGSVAIAPGARQTLSVNADAGMYLASGNAKSAAELAAGVGYTFLDSYTLRVGTHVGDHDNAFAAGAEARIGRLFTVSGSVRIAAASDVCNIYMIGLSASF